MVKNIGLLDILQGGLKILRPYGHPSSILGSGTSKYRGLKDWESFKPLFYWSYGESMVKPANNKVLQSFFRKGKNMYLPFLVIFRQNCHFNGRKIILWYRNDGDGSLGLGSNINSICNKNDFEMNWDIFDA